MRSFTAQLGGREVTIWAPEIGNTEAPSPLLDTIRDRNTDGLYGLDVEGTALEKGGKGRQQWAPDFGLRLVQFAPNDEEAFVLPMADEACRGVAVGLLDDGSTSYTSHTNMDVLSVATVLGVDITMRNVDTRSIANAAYTAKRDKRDLKYLATRHGMPELEEAEAALMARFDELYRAAHPEKGRRAIKNEDLQAFGWEAVSIDDPVYLIYAGLDAITARRLLPILIAATGNGPKVIDTEVWLAGRANRIQLRGMLVDVPRLDEVQGEAQRETSAATERVAELTGGIKIKSPKLKDWFGDHGVDWSSWTEHGGALTKTGAPSLAGDSAAVLRTFDLDDEGRQTVEEFLRAQAWADRLMKAKGVRDHLAPDGRVHPVLVPNGATATSRMSSSAPNMQNFSPATMGVFIPDPGHVLGRIDLDQVELRVVAALAREEKMIEAVHAGIDLHDLTAELIGRPRKVAKRTNFLIVYGGGAPALAKQTGLPIDECAAIIRDWYATYPKIDAYRQYLGLERDAVYTISGRRLPIAWTPDGDARYWANVNYMVQSSARDLLVDAWMTLDREGYGDTIWFPVHDEFTLHAPEEDWPEVAAAAERAMCFDFLGVPITATAEVLRDEHGVSRWLKED